MSEVVIKVENISKQYQLGKIGYGTLRHDLQSWWAKVRGKDDPNSIIGTNQKHKDLNEDFWALKDVSFEVKQGGAVGIIGKNGAGKSTLLKMLSRTTVPTSGNLYIKGKIASLLEVGTGFHPELTGRENVYLNGAILGMKKREIDKKYDEIVDFSGIEKFIDTPIKRYSSGMYVRLAFAVAAHLDSDILILDEVLAVGDAEFQKKCLGKMDDVAKRQGRTILFVSHNMGLINKLCDHCILLEKGNKIFEGKTFNAIEKYLVKDSDKSNFYINFPQDENLDAQIVKAKITNIKGIETGKINYQEKFKIKINIIVREKYEKYHTLLVIKDAMGNNVIFTTDTDINDSIITKSIGHYEYSITIPSKLLKPGSYSIRFMLIRRDKGRVLSGKILSDNDEFPLCFEIVDLISRKSVENRWGNSIIAPELIWKAIKK